MISTGNRTVSVPSQRGICDKYSNRTVFSAVSRVFYDKYRQSYRFQYRLKGAYTISTGNRAVFSSVSRGSMINTGNRIIFSTVSKGHL